MNLFLIKSAMAQIYNPVITGLGRGGSGSAPAKFGSLISSLVAAFLIFASLFALINLLQGGLGWITSGGDKAGIEGARDRIINAFIGLVIVAAAWAIFLLITQFLGINAVGGGGFNIQLPTLFSQ